MPFPPTDERRHPPGAGSWWQETWAFDLWTPDGVGAFTWLTLLPNQHRACYWAVLARPGEPVLYLADLDVALPRSGLEVRSEGLWASHECEVAFEQWTVANEAYAVALDHPDDALGRALGRPTPVAFDLEWYAEAAPTALDRTAGYHQAGTVDALVELEQERLVFEASASRSHWWGVPPAGGEEVEGLELALRLGGDPNGSLVVRALTPDGWHEWRRPP
jgi:hypothetical protein